MFFYLILAVIGSAVAAPQSFLSIPTSATGFAFPSSTFGLPAQTNTFAPQNFQSFAPRQTDSFIQPILGRRTTLLDSSVFAPNGVQFAGPLSHVGRQVPYVRSRNEYLNDNGEFSSNYEGSDGTTNSVTGTLHPTNDGKDSVVHQKGSYTYISPEGIPVSVSFIADAHGFRAVSDSIPKQVLPIVPTF